MELSYLSDRGFLEEFFESEFDNGKEQETLLHLKKQRANWAFTALAQTRLMDFTTATERLPDLGFFVVGQPLWGQMLTYDGFNGRVSTIQLTRRADCRCCSDATAELVD